MKIEYQRQIVHFYCYHIHMRVKQLVTKNLNILTNLLSDQFKRPIA